jgi:SAM-dependent methyltransferase
MSGSVALYDDFSVDYDRFVDWTGRLAAELPFVESQLQDVGARRVLDAACGTGMHAIALVRRGYEVVGADPSAGMIERARANAQTAGVDASFETAGFGALHEHVGGDFDAVLCLGNSLPHVLTPSELAETLEDFAASLLPGGLVLIQNRNFDRVLEQGERWMEPQAYREDEAEWLFARFYDFEAADRLTFNVVTLRREEDGWEQRISSTQLWPLRQQELVPAVEAAGFGSPTCWGDMQGSPFDSAQSPNLVLTARLVE